MISQRINCIKEYNEPNLNENNPKGNIKVNCKISAFTTNKPDINDIKETLKKAEINIKSNINNNINKKNILGTNGEKSYEDIKMFEDENKLLKNEDESLSEKTNSDKESDNTTNYETEISNEDDSKNEEECEPLTDPNNQQLNFDNLKFPELWANYKKQLDCNWRSEELDFSTDHEDFLKLPEQHQNIVKMILAFFANSDGIVNINIRNRIMNEITAIEAITAYTFQSHIENIHGETYTLLLQTIIKKESERSYLFNAIKNINSIKLISEWAFKWIESDEPLTHRIVAFACIEGILFSSAFAYIFWLKKNLLGNNSMQGLTKSNEFISRDENEHKNFAVLMYHRFIKKPKHQIVKQIIEESVNIGIILNQEIMGSDVLGLCVEDMNTYIKYVADRLYYSLTYKKIYNVKNPLSFMETIGMQQKTNFHESRPTEYKSAYSNSNNSLEMMDDDDF